MIVGNKANIETLKKYIDMFFADDPKAPHFLIVSGPQHIGKSSIVLDILREYMGNYIVTDTLQIKDFSEQMDKKHNLKLKTIITSETYKTLIKEQNYQDIGIRDVNNRLQQSAIGKHKVVVLENIERMIGDAANAFLKTAEEPLPKRLIIATTSNATQLLETIISRAITIKFHELSNQELTQWMKDKDMFGNNQEIREVVIHMAMGKPGIAHRIYELVQENPQLEPTIITLIHNLSTGNKKFFAHDALKALYKY